jgi:hypothetical protein
MKNYFASEFLGLITESRVSDGGEKSESAGL